MAVTNDKPTPYAPPSAVLELIERHRERGLPSPVSAEVLARSGVSDSLIPRTLQALQVLELITEDGAATETFEGLRLAPEAEYKQRLEEWLKGAYADVFSFVDPSTDDETSIRDAFRSYQPVGQQTRMVTLFLGLCKAAGLVPDKPTPPRQRSRTATPSPPKRSPSKKSSRSTSSDIPAPLAGLLSSLPPQGQGWTEAQRKKFLDTFGAVLDFCFPINEDKAPEGNDNSEKDQQR